VRSARRKNKRKLAITDALISLDAAGLIERRSGHVMASEVARRLDEMMPDVIRELKPVTGQQAVYCFWPCSAGRQRAGSKDERG